MSRCMIKTANTCTTRAKDPGIEKILVTCLNDHRKLVIRAQADPQNQYLLKKLTERSQIEKDQKRLQAATVRDTNDLGETDVVAGQRTRKPVGTAYKDLQFDSDGNVIDPEGPESQKIKKGKKGKKGKRGRKERGGERRRQKKMKSIKKKTTTLTTI